MRAARYTWYVAAVIAAVISIVAVTAVVAAARGAERTVQRYRRQRELGGTALDSGLWTLHSRLFTRLLQLPLHQRYHLSSHVISVCCQRVDGKC